MPRISRRTPLVRQSWTDRQRDAAIDHDFFHAFADKEEHRRCYEDLADELLPLWIEEHPFTRPWMWWQHTAPEPRRIIGYVEKMPKHLQYIDPHRKDWKEPVEEEQLDYLVRLDLLTDFERRLLEKQR